ncbi:DUF4304 domain-containing protein [Luteolibacter luteus]|uniref:DUF4304 domain-containing protein n=1 Tax=Luteolibacter luteus TaxID=2728835 RepID=A0A858REH0_9BACT|nr:DUF4304 domain-containing protein [Luteolibacter luteus]QJE95011.1 DUF4304 domain-containing protein [Luteolibacter luteus]
MPSDEKRVLLRAIAPVMKAAGFKKKDATWHRVRGGFIQTFNVQGSQWAKSFYLNLGIYITELGDEATPLEYRCHIRIRVGHLADDRARYEELLDMENSIPHDMRFQELNDIIALTAIPWLEELSDCQGIRNWISREQQDGLILKSVFDHYGATRPKKDGN